MRIRVAVALIVAVAVPQLAFARPAVIRVFEATVRAEPAPDAPIVHRFAERTAVSVSEESKDGWRRVRLPDGGTGWIDDTAIALDDSVAAPPPPPRAPAQKPDLRPRLFVEDAGQLPRLMEKDPKFGAQAESLAQRRSLSYGVGGLGLATAVALMIAGANDMNTPPPGDPNFGKTPGGINLFLGGMASLLVGSVVALAVYPRRSEVLDLVNGWNLAHPDEQLALQPVVLVAADPPFVQ